MHCLILMLAEASLDPAKVLVRQWTCACRSSSSVQILGITWQSGKYAATLLHKHIATMSCICEDSTNDARQQTYVKAKAAKAVPKYKDEGV